MATDKEFGEGNYKAAREYDEGATAAAQDPAGVARAAKEAAAALETDEASELARAEAEGKAHARS